MKSIKTVKERFSRLLSELFEILMSPFLALSIIIFTLIVVIVRVMYYPCGLFLLDSIQWGFTDKSLYKWFTGKDIYKQ